MNSRLIYAVFWLLFTAWNFYWWGKNNNRDYLWSAGFGMLAFVGEAIYFFSIATSAPRGTLLVMGIINKIIDIIGGGMFFFLLIKSLRKK